MSIEEKLIQIEKLLGEIKREITAGGVNYPTDEVPLSPAQEWLASKLRTVPMGKPFKTTQLMELLSPDDSIMTRIYHGVKYTGTPSVVFGKFLKDCSDLNLNGLKLQGGVSNGCTTYRVIPTED